MVKAINYTKDFGQGGGGVNFNFWPFRTGIFPKTQIISSEGGKAGVFEKYHSWKVQRFVFFK